MHLTDGTVNLMQILCLIVCCTAMQEPKRINSDIVHYRMTGSVFVTGPLLDSPVSDRVPRSTWAIILSPILQLRVFAIQDP